MAAPTLDSIHAPSDPPTSLGPLDGVAEGIERPVQASVLRRLGCTRGQGYLYSRPLPPAELEATLARGVVDLPGRPAVRAKGGSAKEPANVPIPIRRSRGAA